MPDDWKCSKCGEVPKVMQADTDPKLCVPCYDKEQAATPATPPPFDTGTRVTTPAGDGFVAYVRMGGPDFGSVSSVSVVLDSKKNEHGYTGTIYLAELVTAIDKPVSHNRRVKP